MANCDVWDVVKVPFPYTNRPVQQYRPALVVAAYQTPGSPVLLWVLMITSSRHRRWTGDVNISNFQMAGLPAASMIRSAKLATVAAMEADPLGSLPASDRDAVRAEIESRLMVLLRIRS